VGVLSFEHREDGATDAAAELDLALDTYKLGYFLIDTIELDPVGTGALAVELLVVGPA
jgi:hypothetical protein